MVKQGMPFVEINVSETSTEEIDTSEHKDADNPIKLNEEIIEDTSIDERSLAQPLIPDLGDVDEVEVIEVCVEVGQKVESEDSIMILETDKAAMEIPASVNGEVKNILINVGDMVKQGMPFVEIETIKKAFFIVSISTKGIPCLTISPTLMRIFLTSPLTEAGISIAALSVSRIIIESSDSTF